MRKRITNIYEMKRVKRNIKEDALFFIFADSFAAKLAHL